MQGEVGMRPPGRRDHDGKGHQEANDGWQRAAGLFQRASLDKSHITKNFLLSSAVLLFHGLPPLVICYYLFWHEKGI